LALIIPKMYLKVFANIPKYPTSEWRNCITSNNKLYSLLMFGSELTNKITSDSSVFWGCAQRIIWRNTPMYDNNST
ncbi:Hypothetical protein FKW44_008072, partial [Caligus rogercresseyi]